MSYECDQIAGITFTRETASCPEISCYVCILTARYSAARLPPPPLRSTRKQDSRKSVDDVDGEDEEDEENEPLITTMMTLMVRAV